jgi:hypothetical protein
MTIAASHALHFEREFDRWRDRGRLRATPASLGEALFDLPAPPQLPHKDAIDTTTDVPGILLHWLRAAGGEWLALVTYPQPFADQRKQTTYLERQLVPAYALRPRKYGSHRQ